MKIDRITKIVISIVAGVAAILGGWLYYMKYQKDQYPCEYESEEALVRQYPSLADIKYRKELYESNFYSAMEKRTLRQEHLERTGRADESSSTEEREDQLWKRYMERSNEFDERLMNECLRITGTQQRK